MPAQLIGAHMPTGGGLDQAIRNGQAIGCTAVQVFTSSPQQWASKPLTEEGIAKFRAAVTECGMEGAVISHDSYLINLSALAEEARKESREALTRELNRCGALGIPFVVSHLGAHMGEGVDAGLQLVAQGVRQALEESPESVTLLAETTAGQGSSLDARFEEIARLFELTGNPARLGVCLDTCHIFAAGYDLRTEEDYAATFAEFDRLVGVEKIKVIHCNDSAKPFGSRKDRHAHLGEGEIGPTAFECLVNDPRFERVPIVVETPDAEKEHARNVAALWAWRRTGTN